jgi:hypothetical protein
MTAIEISAPSDDPRQRTQAVLQVIDMLDLYQAELARILGLQCGDIGQLANAQKLLQADSTAWVQAERLIRFYRLLYVHTNGDGVAMRHWLRRMNSQFQQTPHLMLVDEDRLMELINFLQAAGVADLNHSGK